MIVGQDDTRRHGFPTPQCISNCGLSAKSIGALRGSQMRPAILNKHSRTFTRHSQGITYKATGAANALCEVSSQLGVWAETLGEGCNEFRELSTKNLVRDAGYAFASTASAGAGTQGQRDWYG